VSDTSFPLPDDAIAPRLLAAFDAEGKIPRALAALGPIEGSDVVLLDADRGFRAGQLAAIGAHLTLLERPERIDALRAAAADIPGVTDVRAGTPDATGLDDASADVLVSLWSAFRGPSPVAQVAEADRVLRPDGRLLVVHDYGRDDHVRMEPSFGDDAIAWSRRDGWFLTHGFRIRVIHALWTFADGDEASILLGAAFGEPGAAVAATLSRPRASHNVAVYHRSRGGLPWVAPDRDDAEDARGDGGAAKGRGPSSR
jgi:SAM-dependent methyltransferase